MSGSPDEAGRPRRREQRGEIEMLFEMVGEAVEHLVDHRVVGDGAARDPKPGEKGAAEAVAREEAVQITPGDPAVGADRAVGTAPALKTQIEHRPGEPGAAGDAEMHFIAAPRHAARDLPAGGCDEPLGAAEHSLHLEEPKPRCLAGRTFASLR